jgi:tetratricopeptide (TPR) repeat protein
MFAACNKEAPPPAHVPTIFAVEKTDAASAVLLTAPQQALDLATEAVGDDPQYLRAHNLRAVALTRLGRFEDAAAAAEAVLALESNLPEVELMLGMLYEKLQRADKSQAHYAKAVELYAVLPDGSPEEMLKRATALYLAQGIGPSVDALNDIIEQYPNFHQAQWVKQRIVKSDREFLLNHIAAPDSGSGAQE